MKKDTITITRAEYNYLQQAREERDSLLYVDAMRKKANEDMCRKISILNYSVDALDKKCEELKEENEGMRDELQARIAGLEAERDALKEEVERYGRKEQGQASLAHKPER